MIEAPLRIAAWSGLVTLALFAGGALVLSVAEWLRKGKGARPGNIVGRMLGFAALCLLPLGLASIPGFIAAAVVDELGTPPIAFPFVSIAGLAGLRAARDAGSGEMKGCSQLIATFVATYIVVWGAVAWWATRGATTLEADLASLRWLQPPLAALPFSLALWRIAGKKRTAWLLFGSLALLSAYFAVWFFSFEAGFAADMLPASDWLRFPLVAFAGGVLLALVPLATALRAPVARRARQVREVSGKMILLALLTLPMGFAWAAARAAVAAL